jgi:hypothetical protein
LKMELTQLIEEIRLSDLPKEEPKNFFDITGIRNKEVINSRVLGYFLDAKGEHGFGTLFYDALIELIADKIKHHAPAVDLANFRGSFVVAEEEPTRNAIEKDEQKKRIDLSLKGEGWAMIIENKLYHDVINPLGSYWTHLEEEGYKNILGIILSLNDVGESKCRVQDKNIRYINLTHGDLINQISKLFRFSSAANETSLFYLKEYFKTIETHYSSKRNNPIMNKIINDLVSQRTRVNEILRSISESENFINRTMADFFSEKEIEKSSGGFYISKSLEGIYFWPDIKKLITENRLIIYYGVIMKGYREEEIENLKQTLKEIISRLDKGYFEMGKYMGKDHAHLVVYSNLSFLNAGDKFDEKFRKLLDQHFFNEDGIVEATKSSGYINRV